MTEFARSEEIEGVILVKPKRFEDSRGFFTESYNQEKFAANGIDCTFVQDNHSLSRQTGVVRGLHFQLPPAPQAKLVRCIRGSIIDYAVDIRVNSPTFGRFVSVELSEKNGHQLFIPVGFAHGFCTLQDDSEVEYKVSSHYAPEHDSGIAHDDPDISIDWPFPSHRLILSEKDQKLKRLSDLPPAFKMPL